jgi:hypothetical protein
LIARQGLGAAQTEQSNLELELQFIQQARIQIANLISSLFNVSSNLDPNSAQATQLQAAIASLQASDQQLSQQQSTVTSQEPAVEN